MKCGLCSDSPSCPVCAFLSDGRSTRLTSGTLTGFAKAFPRRWAGSGATKTPQSLSAPVPAPVVVPAPIAAVTAPVQSPSPEAHKAIASAAADLAHLEMVKREVSGIMAGIEALRAPIELTPGDWIGLSKAVEAGKIDPKRAEEIGAAWLMALQATVRA